MFYDPAGLQDKLQAAGVQARATRLNATFFYLLGARDAGARG